MSIALRARLSLVLNCLLGLAGPGALGLAQPAAPAWVQFSGIAPTTQILYSVFMLDTTGAWIAGGGAGGGAAYRVEWNGSQWAILSSQQFPAPLRSIAAVSDTDVWAVGEQGLIVHRDPSGWHEVSAPVAGAQLLSVQMLGNGDEGWAAGFVTAQSQDNDAATLILHYSGGQWARDQTVNEAGQISSLHFAAGEGWAVGTGIWRYSGGQWSRVAEPAPCFDVQCFASYAGVRAISAGDAWAVGSRTSTCAICTIQPYAIHFGGGSWHLSLPDQGIANEPQAPYSGLLRGVSFTPDGVGLAVGQYQRAAGPNQNTLILSYHDNKWYNESLAQVQGELYSVSQADANHALAVGSDGIVLGYGYSAAQPPAPTPTAQRVPNPTDRVADPHDAAVTYFGDVGHTLRGALRDYWQSHGGLAQFGYPLTEEFQEVSPTDGKPYTVQYFERARFERHPENRSPYDVLLGLLGRTITQGRENEQPFRSRPPNPGKGGPLYFPETGHFLEPEFTGYWISHGGLPVYGYPISEAFNEVSPTDGKSYLVQYFERNRFEYHPELPEPYRVSLGLLGAQVLRQRGWLP